MLRVRIPAGVREVKVEGGRIAFKADAGKGMASAKEVHADLRSEGWKEQVAAFEGPAGAASLQKGNVSVTISYTDVGLGDAEVTLDAIGATLARKP
ncbi:hypothetical protein [Paludisphaera soli]|uniref:hypothetical protein n=1 Tax=Paludisphaera soli TaxID=2712865 RepID=UPI0013EDB7DE|nr:hypothetical protein [Paludisphaera soli]